MKPIDYHYLSLQFRKSIYEKNGTEFQTFFEKIMEKVFSDFQIIRPLGNKGDKGNDGYRKKSGIYYQVYAPITPKVNETKAEKKLQKDFLKQKVGWDEISKIKEYNFVFNDKYLGSVQLLEKTITQLNVENPYIEFKLFLAKDLEKVFLKLPEKDILDLGFNIDHRQAIDIVYTSLENVKNELEREDVGFAKRILENIKEIMLEIGDENLYLEYEILECKCLQKTERIDEAKEKYENIIKKFSDKPYPILYLAEIYLYDKDIEKNRILLKKAEEIDNNFWLLKFEQITRKLFLKEEIETINIDEKNFPEDPKIKANFYRLFGWLLEMRGENIKADSFIEKAIHLNPNRFSNYIQKISIIENRLIQSQETSQRLLLAQGLLDEINKAEIKFLEYGDIGARNKAILNSKKMSAFLAQDNIPEFERVSIETMDLFLSCYFDVQIENYFIQILQFIFVPNAYFNRLLEYFKNSNNKISDALSKELIAQFCMRGTLFSDGKFFFQEIHNLISIEFINDLENINYKKILAVLKGDVQFALILANTLDFLPELRKMQNPLHAAQ